MPQVADLWVELRGISGEFTKSMGEAGAASERADGKIAGVAAGAGKMALGVVAAAVAVGVGAVKMASEFDNTMNHLRTLANVAPAQLKPLSDGVLKLAGQVGFSPGSLADALYHVESSFASTGISSANAMKILQTAAEGAKIGGADLTDVTNALDAAVVSGIPGVQNYQDAMGSLLKVVGSGDMQMQDLANAFSTGILAIGKQYGATLNDVGAALATFGDNNIRGQVAATDLRMAIMDLTKQAGPGRAALKSIGISAGQLGQDMQKGGMNKALIDLRNHLNAAGITGTKVGSFLEDAFTKKSSAPLAILLGQFDRLQSKYGELNDKTHTFGQAWKATTDQLATKFDQAKANAETLMIELGQKLIPVAAKIFDVFNKAFSWIPAHMDQIKKFGGVIKDFLVGALIVAGAALASIAVEAVIAAAPFIAISLAVGALARWLISLYEHNAKFQAFVNGMVTSLRADLGAALKWAQSAFAEFKQAVSTVIAAVTGYYEAHKTSINETFSKVMGIVRQVGGVFQSEFALIRAVVTVAVHVIEDLWARFGMHLLQHIQTAFNALLQVIRGALQVIKGVLDVFTGIFTGDWSKVWHGITEIFSGAWNIIVGLLKYAINLISTVLGAGMAVISALWGLAWHSIETLFKHIWDGIRAALSAYLHLMYLEFVVLPGKVIGYVASLGNQLLSWALGVMAAMLRGLARGWADVSKWVSGIPGAILRALGDVAGDMLNVGQNVVQGIWNGISGMGGWLADKVKDFAKNAVTSPIKSVLGIFSPSRVMADEVGKYIPMGLAQGITDNLHYVHAAAGKMAGAVTGMGATSNVAVSPGQFGRTSGPAIAGAASGSFGAAGAVVNLTIQVQGNVMTEKQLVAVVEKGFLELGMRRGATRTFQPYQRG